MRRRIAWLAGYGVAAGAAGLAAGIGWDGFGAPVPPVIFAAAAMVMGVALIPLTLAVMPPGRAVVGLLGIGAGAFLGLYGYGAVSTAPIVDPAGGATFIAGLAGIGPLAVAAFGTVARPVGIAGGIALIAAFVTALIGGSGAESGVLPTALATAGLLAIAVWASATARTASGRRRIRAEGPRAAALAASWRRPFPPLVPRAARVAGLGLIAATALASARPLDQRVEPLQQVAELVAAGGVALLVWSIERAASGLGRGHLSGVWELIGLVLPIGMGALTFAGAIALAWVGPLASSSGVFTVAELDGTAAACLSLVLARLAWLLREGPRRMGILLGGAGFASGLLVARPSAPEDPSVVALAALALVAVVAGVWLVRLGDLLTGRAPIAVLRTPAGTDVTATQPPPRAPEAAPAPVANRPKPRTDRPQTERRRRGQVIRDRFPRTQTEPRYDVDELARRMGVTAAELRAARPAYRELRIPKRTGGMRTLHAPDPPTLALQRRILRRLLARLPVHDAAHGFERGRSIVSNAAPHAGRPVILKLDLHDFFGATRASRVRRYWRVLGWDKESAAILTRLTTLGGGLPQGAPTSPRLANLVNVRLDARLAGLARVLEAAYTRYADDVTFSFPTDDGNVVRDAMRGARSILWHEARYEIHRAKKLQVRRSWERQIVTGLVVNQRPRLPRETRSWLRAVEHRTYTGGQPTLTREQLRGWQALESMVDRGAAG